MYRSANILLIRILACAIILLPAVSNGETSNSSAKLETVEVWLCWEPSTDTPPESDSQLVHIKRGLELFVKLTQVFSPRDFSFVIETNDKCRKRIPTLTKTCRTHANTIMCDLDTISRATRMSGWMSALTFSYSGGKRIGEVPAPLAQYLADAEGKYVGDENLLRFRRLSDVDWNLENVHTALDLLEAWLYLASGKELPDDYFPEFLPLIHTTNVMAESTLNFVFAYIFGHEIYHVSDTCPIPSALPATVNAALDRLADVQVKADALCFNPPSPYEIEADRCALTYMHHIYHYHEAQKLANHDFSKRYAVDVLSQLILGRLAATGGTPTVRLDSGVNLKNHNTPDGYLFTPIRVIAVAELIRTISESNNWEVGLCDTAAMDTFHALTGATYCPDEQQFEYASKAWLNAFEDYFPERTMRAMYNNNPRPVMKYWDDFSCGHEDIRSNQNN